MRLTARKDDAPEIGGTDFRSVAGAPRAGYGCTHQCNRQTDTHIAGGVVSHTMAATTRVGDADSFAERIKRHDD